MEERLRDGERILVRPIEPDDREALADGIRRMSPESRYRRFFSPIAGLTEEQRGRGLLRMRLPHRF